MFRRAAFFYAQKLGHQLGAVLTAGRKLAKASVVVLVAIGLLRRLRLPPVFFPGSARRYEPWSAWSRMAQTSPSVWSIMTASGDAASPTWITEVGAPTGGPGDAAPCAGMPGAPRAGHDSLCLQAAAITEVVQNDRSLSWLGPAFIDSFQDVGTNQARHADFFGVLTADDRPKLSYVAPQRDRG